MRRWMCLRLHGLRYEKKQLFFLCAVEVQDFMVEVGYCAAVDNSLYNILAGDGDG